MNGPMHMSGFSMEAMQVNQIPANIWVMDLTPEKLARMRPVTLLDIFESNTNNFHPEGLFSTTIFGRVGSDERDVTFSYINIKTPIMHPLIYQELVKLKGLYGGIMDGRAFAIWDDKVKDFLPSDELHGDTGYYFFMQHWKDIVHQKTGSDTRELKIKFIEKFKDQAMTKAVLVMPAGLRDLMVDPGTGQRKESEINDIYRKILGASNTIIRNIDNPILDNSRATLQRRFNELFTYIRNMMEGKRGFLQDKWAKRSITNGTRNVITAMDNSPAIMGAPNSPKYNNTVMGIYQLIKGCLPVAKYLLLHGWISKAFGHAETTANLVDPVTLKRVALRVSPDVMDRWTRNDGLDKVINSMSEPELRGRPVIIAGHYLGLIYIGPDKTFRIFGDIDELPADRDRKDVHPLTLCELVYLSGYQRWNTLATHICRYPVIGEGSIYPSFVYVKTSVRGEMRSELGDDWNIIDADHIALEFPKRGLDVYVESLVPHFSRVAGLAADYDGDTSSANTVYTDNSLDEINKYFNSARAYVAPEGGLRASPLNDTATYVIFNLTGD